MEALQQIVDQLGVDYTVFYQFATLCVLFLITKFLFFNALQFVIENREEKTTKLESSAEVVTEKANKLSNEYKDKIDEAYRASKEKTLAEKNNLFEIAEKYTDLQQALESHMNSEEE